MSDETREALLAWIDIEDPVEVTRLSGQSTGRVSPTRACPKVGQSAPHTRIAEGVVPLSGWVERKTAPGDRPELLACAYEVVCYERWYMFVASPASTGPLPSVSSRNVPNRWTIGFSYFIAASEEREHWTRVQRVKNVSSCVPVNANCVPEAEAGWQE